jgi:hypothetical protein
MAYKNSRFTSLSINLPAAMLKDVDDIVNTNRPFAKRHSVLVAVIYAGLEALGEEPTRLSHAMEGIEKLRGAA